MTCFVIKQTAFYEVNADNPAAALTAFLECEGSRLQAQSRGGGMRAQTLTEFAEDMRRQGDIRQSDLADEILALIDVEEEVAEPYSTLCADLEMYAPNDMGENWPRMVEWLGDRSNLLDEIEKEFEEAKRPKTGTGDIADMVRELLGTMKAAEAILEEHDWPGTDFLDALENLAKMPLLRRNMTYDLSSVL